MSSFGALPGIGGEELMGWSGYHVDEACFAYAGFTEDDNEFLLDFFR
jgi:hypothetical protein